VLRLAALAGSGQGPTQGGKPAARVELDIATLPYNRELLAFLHEQKAQGRTLVLVTARIAKFRLTGLAAHLNLFDEVLATDGDRNLAGPHKSRVARSVTLRRTWL